MVSIDKRLIVMVIVILLLGAYAPAAGATLPAGQDVGMQAAAQSGGDAFNAVVFEEEIHQQFAGKVKGYSFVVANADGFAAKVSGGYAQDPSDGNVRMKTYRASGTGSVAKVLSGIALLHLFAEHKLSNGSVEEQLDTPIWGKLPPKWQQAYAGKNLEQITYRELLQHKSGFRISDETASANTTGSKLSYVLERGVKLSDIGHRSYNNFNFAILGFLIPAIAYPNAVAWINAAHEDLDVDAFSKEIGQYYGHLYEQYMHEVIFPLTVAPISPTCKPLDELAADQYAKSYNSKDDKTGTVINAGYCRSQGAWTVSAQDLATFARTFELTNRFFGAGVRRMLFQPNPADEKDDDRIVYAEIIKHDGFGDETGQAYWPYQGGVQQGYRAALIRLPYGYVGVGMTNSPEFSSGQLARAILDSFYDATRGKPISLAKHGMTLAQYQKYTTELADHGSWVDWVDFYNVGSQVYVNVIYRPAQAGWQARHGMDGAGYQDFFDKYVKNGPYTLKQLDSYVQDGQVKYAAVLVKGSSAGLRAYHGLSAQQHQDKFDEWSGDGYVPVSITVTSIAGQRFYAAFYEKKETNGLFVKSALTPAAYQQTVDDQIAAGRKLAYLNAYDHNGDPYYIAIFYGNIAQDQVLRHGMSAATYQEEFDKWTGKGYALTMVVGVAAGSQPNYAAVWQKAPPAPSGTVLTGSKVYLPSVSR